MYLQLLIEFIPILIKCFSRYETLVAISIITLFIPSLSCFELTLCSYGLKIVLSLLDLSLTSLYLFQEFLTSLLLTKY